jgi:hypothetical protein
MHINVFTAFQDDFSPDDVPYWSLPTMSQYVMQAMLPEVEVQSLHEGEDYACDSDLPCQNTMDMRHLLLILPFLLEGLLTEEVEAQNLL